MEHFYNIFKNLTNFDHKLNRSNYFITIILYNVLAHFTVGILVGGYSLLTRTWGYWSFSNILIFILCLPLYSSHYHRLRDTGLNKKASLAVPFIGFLLKVISILFSVITSYSTSGYFGASTFSILNGLYLDQSVKFYILLALFTIIEAIYILVNLVLILTKTDQFSKQELIN